MELSTVCLMMHGFFIFYCLIFKTIFMLKPFLAIIISLLGDSGVHQKPICPPKICVPITIMRANR